MRIVAGDIGGTHARFALAEHTPDGPRLGPMHRYRTRDYPGVAEAWAAFARDVGAPLPTAASLAIASPIEGETLRFTNSHWAIGRHTLAAELGLERLLLMNDFGAVAHTVSVLAPDRLEPLCEPAGSGNGLTTVLGLGTGLGVALLAERDGRVEVIETEAAHIGFAPETEEERRLGAAIAQEHGRCSVERIVSGPGLLAIHALLGGAPSDPLRAGDLWTAALDGSDPIAARALDLLLGAFGAAAGDLTLAHGSMRVVVTGGLANRMKARLAQSAFHDRFLAKGRYRARQERVTIQLATEPEPGLLGAAIAFQRAAL